MLFHQNKLALEKLRLLFCFVYLVMHKAKGTHHLQIQMSVFVKRDRQHETEVEQKCLKESSAFTSISTVYGCNLE